VVKVSGWDFEHWVLKLYCGMYAANFFTQPGTIPDYVLHALFRSQRLPMDLGLYMSGDVGDTLTVGPRLRVMTLARPDNGEACAIEVGYAGIGFRCTLRPGQDGGTGRIDGRDRHVPGIELRDERAGGSRELVMDWS
jgi:hypothetical protein